MADDHSSDSQPSYLIEISFSEQRVTLHVSHPGFQTLTGDARLLCTVRTEECPLMVMISFLTVRELFEGLWHPPPRDTDDA